MRYDAPADNPPGNFFLRMLKMRIKLGIKFFVVNKMFESWNKGSHAQMHTKQFSEAADISFTISG